MSTLEPTEAELSQACEKRFKRELPYPITPVGEDLSSYKYLWGKICFEVSHKHFTRFKDFYLQINCWTSRCLQRRRVLELSFSFKSWLLLIRSQLQDQFVSFCSNTCFLRFDQTVSTMTSWTFSSISLYKKVIPSRSDENQMNILDLWPGNSWNLHTFDLFGNKSLLKVWNVPDGSRLHHKIV